MGLVLEVLVEVVVAMVETLVTPSGSDDKSQ